MKSGGPALNHFWVSVDSDRGGRYFARFLSHYPIVRWFATSKRDDAYCFATEADARHVADYFVARGRRARVVTIRPTTAPPPRIYKGPPTHLRIWVERILAEGASDEGRQDYLARITAGYRALAHRHHPDKGGDSGDMQTLNEAVEWLRTDATDAVPF